MSTKVYYLENFPTFYNMQSVSSNAVARALETKTIPNKQFTQNGTVRFLDIVAYGKLRIAKVEIAYPTGSNIGTYNGVVLVNDTGFRPVANCTGYINNIHSSLVYHGGMTLETNGKLTLSESWGMISGASIAYAILVWVETS